MGFASGGRPPSDDGAGARGRLVTDGGDPDSGELAPTLPPSDATPARLLALSGAVVDETHRTTITALLDELEPDVIVATPPQATTVTAALPRSVDRPVLSPSRSLRPDAVATNDGEVLITTIPDGAEAFSATDVRAGRRGTPASDDSEAAPAASHRVCLTTQLSLAVDPYQRRASVEGLDAYAAQLPAGWLGEGSTHCSTALRAGYRTTATVDGTACSLVGIGRSEAALGVGAKNDDDHTATLLEVYRNGTVGVDSIDPAAFGLRGLDGVGDARAETLRAAGYETPTEVAAAPPNELAALDGLGGATAGTIQAAATARSRDTVVATGDDSLPYGDPVFVDVETDGLEPSCAWLVGVLDGDAEDGHYMAFQEVEPGDGSHLEAFLNWRRANAEGRPLVAWNGYGFDFPVLEAQIRQHCPAHLDAWEDAYQFDPLWWAREKNGGNAALPGRTDELEPVAEALGWQPATTGIDGDVVARVYSAYRRRSLAAEDPRAVEEPDWERLNRYCEDDVRALATIYEALAEAARRDPDSTSKTSDSGTQGALSDFT